MILTVQCLKTRFLPFNSWKLENTCRIVRTIKDVMKIIILLLKYMISYNCRILHCRILSFARINLFSQIRKLCCLLQIMPTCSRNQSLWFLEQYFVLFSLIYLTYHKRYVGHISSIEDIKRSFMWCVRGVCGYLELEPYTHWEI